MWFYIAHVCSSELATGYIKECSLLKKMLEEWLWIESSFHLLEVHYAAEVVH